jgi:hypothetical protein
MSTKIWKILQRKKIANLKNKQVEEFKLELKRLQEECCADCKRRHSTCDPFEDFCQGFKCINNQGE